MVCGKINYKYLNGVKMYYKPTGSVIQLMDGDHDPKHQSFLLSNVDKLITKNGVYICEDVQTYEIALQLVNSVPSEYKKFTYIWDGRCSVGRYDDICIVVDRR